MGFDVDTRMSVKHACHACGLVFYEVPPSRAITDYFGLGHPMYGHCPRCKTLVGVPTGKDPRLQAGSTSVSGPGPIG